MEQMEKDKDGKDEKEESGDKDQDGTEELEEEEEDITEKQQELPLEQSRLFGLPQYDRYVQATQNE